VRLGAGLLDNLDGYGDGAGMLLDDALDLITFGVFAGFGVELQRDAGAVRGG
jgi:hypothetical protein